MSKNKPMHGFLIVITAISLLSLSVLLLPSSLTIANAQVSSDGNNNHRDDSGIGKQMGICIIGVRSPCNGDT